MERLSIFIPVFLAMVAACRGDIIIAPQWSRWLQPQLGDLCPDWPNFSPQTALI